MHRFAFHFLHHMVFYLSPASGAKHLHVTAFWKYTCTTYHAVIKVGSEHCKKKHSKRDVTPLFPQHVNLPSETLE